jgi:hypothetical protein
LPPSRSKGYAPFSPAAGIAGRYRSAMNPLAVVALVILTPLALGSLYGLVTVGFSAMTVLGFVALLGVIGATKRIADDRREARSDDLG